MRRGWAAAPGNVLPSDRLAALTQPTLVLPGGRSPVWIGRAAEAVVATIPGAVHRVLAEQTHAVEPAPLASELLEFLTTAGGSVATPR